MRLSKKCHLYLSNYFEFMASLFFSRDGQTACPGADRVSDVHRGFSRSSGYFNVSFGNAGIKRRLQQNADVERCQQPANANFERFQRQNADIQRYQQQNESSCVGDVGDRKSHRRRIESWGEADGSFKIDQAWYFGICISSLEELILQNGVSFIFWSSCPYSLLSKFCPKLHSLLDLHF